MPSKYLIVEILPRIFQASLLSHDKAVGEVDLVETWRFSSWREMRDFLGSSAIKSGDYGYIISLDSELASTIYQRRVLIRKDADRPIDQAELESLASQLIWHVSAPLEAGVSGASEFSLRQIIVNNLVIDGRRVADPIGLTGREVAVYFNKTSVKRDFLDELTKVLPADRIVLISESGSLWLYSVARLINKQTLAVASCLLVSIFYDVSIVHYFKNNEIGYLKTVNWGEKNILSTIFGNLSVNQKVARDILRECFLKKTSPAFFRKITAFMKGELDDFSSQINFISQKNGSERVFFMPFAQLPLDQLKLDKGVKYSVVDNRFVEREAPFRVKLNKEALNYFSAVAPLVKVSLTPLESLFNKVIQRRLRWRKSLL